MLSLPVALFAQQEKVKNQPYVDNKLFHLGFHVGLHAQDMILTHSGANTNGEVWFAEIPSYSPGFSVGVIGDMYLNPYFNLRFTPTINFGDKKFVFKEQESGDEFRTSVRSSYLTFPLSVKYSAMRLNNFRPYLVGGIYTAFDLGRKRGNPMLLKGTDFGLEFGLGCNLYLPFFPPLSRTEVQLRTVRFIGKGSFRPSRAGNDKIFRCAFQSDFPHGHAYI